MNNNDLISRAWVLAEYDRQHKGPPGGVRKIMAEAPAVDAVPVVQQWISVKDKLPPKQGFYLAFVPEMARVALYYNGYDWIVDDDFYAFGAYEITHWMPLPEPPKMDGDA